MKSSKSQPSAPELEMIWIDGGVVTVYYEEEGHGNMEDIARLLLQEIKVS